MSTTIFVLLVLLSLSSITSFTIVVACIRSAQISKTLGLPETEQFTQLAH